MPPGPPIHVLLLLLALVCFAVAAWQAGAPTWNRLVAVGLVFLAAAFVW